MLKSTVVPGGGLVVRCMQIFGWLTFAAGDTLKGLASVRCGLPPWTRPTPPAAHPSNPVRIDSTVFPVKLDNDSRGDIKRGSEGRDRAGGAMAAENGAGVRPDVD